MSMTIVIFAGGAGTRLWPLSRRNSPKQFEQLREHKSTLQMAVDRIAHVGHDHLYIATNEQYVHLVHEQLPDFPVDHILTEPARRDLAAAVGLTLARLRGRGVTGTIAILWSDHFMDAPQEFIAALEKGEALTASNRERFVFIGETPRFANHNLGWIRSGKQIGDKEFEFRGWKYRPPLAECVQMFQSGEWLWNTGYFIFDIDFVLQLYERFLPDMHQSLTRMAQDDEYLHTNYSQLPALSFDSAIVEKIDPAQAVVLKVNLGWSDPGTLYALKEALEPVADKNIEHGNVLLHSSRDCFIYNEEEKKLVTAVGLDGMIVVNTKDALLVCHKDHVPAVKELLKKLEDQGLEAYL